MERDFVLGAMSHNKVNSFLKGNFRSTMFYGVYLLAKRKCV